MKMGCETANSFIIKNSTYPSPTYVLPDRPGSTRHASSFNLILLDPKPFLMSFSRQIGLRRSSNYLFIFAFSELSLYSESTSSQWKPSEQQGAKLFSLVSSLARTEEKKGVIILNPKKVRLIDCGCITERRRTIEYEELPSMISSSSCLSDVSSHISLRWHDSSHPSSQITCHVISGVISHVIHNLVSRHLKDSMSDMISPISPSHSHISSHFLLPVSYCKAHFSLQQGENQHLFMPAPETLEAFHLSELYRKLALNISLGLDNNLELVRQVARGRFACHKYCSYCITGQIRAGIL